MPPEVVVVLNQMPAEKVSGSGVLTRVVTYPEFPSRVIEVLGSPATAPGEPKVTPPS